MQKKTKGTIAVLKNEIDGWQWWRDDRGQMINIFILVNWTRLFVIYSYWRDCPERSWNLLSSSFRADPKVSTDYELHELHGMAWSASQILDWIFRSFSRQKHSDQLHFCNLYDEVLNCKRILCYICRLDSGHQNWCDSIS